YRPYWRNAPYFRWFVKAHRRIVIISRVIQNIYIRLLPFLPFGKIINPSKDGLPMARELRCADLMPGCNFVAQGKDDSEVMKKAAEHAKRVHKMAAISMDVEKKARAAIRDAGA